MKYNKSLLVCCLFVMLSYTATKAQTYSNESLTLRSDFPSKSALVSNLFLDRIGDRSPIIGAASWADSGRQLQCRSLLQFNYRSLPSMLIDDPSLITSAELILYPVSQNDLDKPRKFFVRRILESWEDSTTMWMNQPAADSVYAAEVLKKKLKNKPIHVDVTRLVLDMLRYGNKGFMICNDNSAEQSMALSQWFASPKNDDEKLRPILVINYRIWTWEFEKQLQMQRNRQPQNTTSPAPTQPVRGNRVGR